MKQGLGERGTHLTRSKTPSMPLVAELDVPCMSLRVMVLALPWMLLDAAVVAGLLPVFVPFVASDQVRSPGGEGKPSQPALICRRPKPDRRGRD